MWELAVVCISALCCTVKSAVVVRTDCLDTTEIRFPYQNKLLAAPANNSTTADWNTTDGIPSNVEWDDSSNSTHQLLECIPPGIFSFPQDFLTQEQRRKGGVLVHVLILFYVCAMIASVCDDYFIPSLEIISDKLSLPPDVAGATFMAIGASSPELFSSILGSFVTEGDIGVGAVIGSAVFNILGITGVVGIMLWNEVLDIDWYPMARDCIAYTITVLCLIWIISDNKVMWWEALVLLCIFMMYICLMYFNKRIEKCARKTAGKVGSPCCCNGRDIKSIETGETSPLLEDKLFVRNYLSSSENKLPNKGNTSSKTSDGDNCVKCERRQQEEKLFKSDNSIAEEGEATELCSPPKDNILRIVWWVFMLPSSTLLYFTIPDPKSRRCKPLFPLAFLLSIAWLGVLSYVAVWMVTIIGYTLSIPDSVSGLTILAVGASVPDLIATVLVAKSGEGNMAMSNLVGSNNFDISICLGVPWIAKALLSDQGYVRLHSSALSYATGILLVTLLAFYMIFVCTKWKLNRSVGITCLFVYAIFLVFACLFEFNVFGNINPPTCF